MLDGLFRRRRRARAAASSARATASAACRPSARSIPREIVATIYHSLGLDLETKLPGPQGRPFPLVDSGKHEIHELF